MDALTTPARFTTGLVFVVAAGVPAKVSTDAKPYSQRAAAADENVAIRTNLEPPAQGRESRESGPSLAVGAHLPARYLRAPIRFEPYHGQAAGDVKFVARGSGPYRSRFTDIEAVWTLRQDSNRRATAFAPGGQQCDPLRLPPEFTHRKWTGG